MSSHQESLPRQKFSIFTQQPRANQRLAKNSTFYIISNESTNILDENHTYLELEVIQLSFDWL